MEKPDSVKIISINVDVTNLDAAANTVKNWVASSASKYICVANVHMCMEAYDDRDYQSVVNSADMVVPDGMPLVWAQNFFGKARAKRVRGPDLMVKLCDMAEKNGIKIGFYGGTEIALSRMQQVLLDSYPALNIGLSTSPPFREMTASEIENDLKSINDKNIQILFVGLGCPKQERWMFDHREKLKCVMVGVGAAFDFISGEKKTAPAWMQSIGLEWLFRLASEPKRLWKRYAKHNPRFVILFFYQLLGGRL